MARGFFVLALMGLFSACAQPQEQPLQPPFDESKFGYWLEDLKREAQAEGVSAETTHEALSEAQYVPRVIELDRKQPESTLTMEAYLAKTVSDRRIAAGRELLAQHRALLSEVEEKYGVPPQVIVALWGIETSYGQNTGSFSVVDALATLAYDGRRSEYFRGELIKALKIIDAGHITATGMDGSWAGAMGQCQFMPSSFLAYAVDYNGDGRRDIWHDKADVFASIANYLSQSGWSRDEERNVTVLLKWNRSRFFAAAVGALAKAIGPASYHLGQNKGEFKP